jgi:aryl-phospho-beta-D-glucosidase BglC (GH1 family)
MVMTDLKRKKNIPLDTETCQLTESNPTLPNLRAIALQISHYADPELGNWWGGNLMGVKAMPLDTGDEELNARIVYAPHLYGPEIYEHDYVSLGSLG